MYLIFFVITLQDKHFSCGYFEWVDKDEDENNEDEMVSNYDKKTLELKRKVNMYNEDGDEKKEEEVLTIYDKKTLKLKRKVKMYKLQNSRLKFTCMVLVVTLASVIYFALG